MPDLPGSALAQELIAKSRDESRASPVEDIIQAIRRNGLGDHAAPRLVGRLWALERMFYYIYGGWGQGLEINDFPPSVKYLFSKQIVDESTHEMLYLDALLHKGFAVTQKDAFRHPSGCFALDSALAYFVFSLRNLATYPHPIRIAALNLGPKVLELAWMEGLTEAIADPDLKGVFESQFVENRSHINMGRRIVEEFIQKPVEAELCRWAVPVPKADSGRFLGDLRFLWGGPRGPGPPAPAPASDRLTEAGMPGL